jgi:hypothetical protein
MPSEFSTKPNVWNIIVLFGSVRAIESHGALDIITGQPTLYFYGIKMAKHDESTDCAMVQTYQMSNLVKHYTLKIHCGLIIRHYHVHRPNLEVVQVKLFVL